MTLLDGLCKEIINKQKIKWFNTRHAQILKTIRKHEKLKTSEIILITSIDKQNALKSLQDLRNEKLLAFNGEHYFFRNELETMLKLIKMVEKKKISEMMKNES